MFRDHRRPLSQVVHEKLVKMSDDSIGATTGKFNVDPNLGHNTKFGVYVEDAEDHLIKSVTFTDSRGNAYGPFTSMSSLYDIINLKVVNYPVGAAPPFDEVRIVRNSSLCLRHLFGFLGTRNTGVSHQFVDLGWVGLTLIWVFHHLVKLQSYF